MTLGDRIKMLREEKKITQSELAHIIHATKQTIYKYENNIVTNIPSDKIEKIAVALETSPSYLMGWDKKNSHNGLNDKTFDLLSNFKKLNDTGMNKVIDYAKDLSINPLYQRPAQPEKYSAATLNSSSSKKVPLLFAASAEDRSPENIALMESEFDDFDDI